MMGAGWKPLSVLCVLLALLLLAQYRMHLSTGLHPEAANIGSGEPSFQTLTERFTALAENKGAPYAFEVLKEAALPPGIDLHLMGHVVGDILYAQQGVGGIKDCTQDFRNACSHSIVIGVLNEFGTGDGTIEKIRDACKRAPGGVGAYTMCFHGLGHGVFSYFGYDIPKAVAFCKRLGTPEYGEQEYTQCVGGITMELIDGGGHDHDRWVTANEKYLDPSDPLSPCDRTLIPAEAKSFCYIYLTPHLFEAAGAQLANPDAATFPKAFSMCDAISDMQLRDVCYGSFGKEFVPLAAARDIRAIDQMSDDEYVTVIGWCMLGPNTDARGQCIGQALASVFWGGENNPDASFRFCSLVSDSAVQRECYKQLGQNIASYTSGQARLSLCGRLPETDRTDCETAAIAPQNRP